MTVSGQEANSGAKAARRSVDKRLNNKTKTPVTIFRNTRARESRVVTASSEAAWRQSRERTRRTPAENERVCHARRVDVEMMNEALEGNGTREYIRVKTDKRQLDPNTVGSTQ
jgi:hypothetical protein